MIVVGTIEWNSDKGIEPIVIVADDVVSLRAQAARIISAEVARGGDAVNYIDDIWHQFHPAPDFDDSEAVEKWLRIFKDATTDLWLNEYATAMDPSEEFTNEGQFWDSRTPA